jgi:acyl-CoA thioesterase I
MQMNYVWWVSGGIVFLLALWWLFSGGQSVSSFKNYPPRNETIVAFGDSLVQGVGASEGKDLFSQVESLTQKRIINKGVSGNTTRDGLNRIDEVLDEEPGVVIVVLGGNDYLRQVPIEETFQNLRTIVARLQKAGAVVIIAGVRGGVVSDRFAPEYEALTDEYDTGYVPNILKGLIARDEYMSDAIHPNDAGYAVIAARIAPLIDALYK